MAGDTGSGHRTIRSGPLTILRNRWESLLRGLDANLSGNLDETCVAWIRDLRGWGKIKSSVCNWETGRVERLGGGNVRRIPAWILCVVVKNDRSSPLQLDTHIADPMVQFATEEMSLIKYYLWGWKVTSMKNKWGYLWTLWLIMEPINHATLSFLLLHFQ